MGTKYAEYLEQKHTETLEEMRAGLKRQAALITKELQKRKRSERWHAKASEWKGGTRTCADCGEDFYCEWFTPCRKICKNCLSRKAKESNAKSVDKRRRPHQKRKAKQITAV